MNGSIETTTITCPGGGSVVLRKHSDQDISFTDFNGVSQSNASEALVKLFATIKANGSGTPPTITRTDA
jgi:hypothetical protein